MSKLLTIAVDSRFKPFLPYIAFILRTLKLLLFEPDGFYKPVRNVFATLSLQRRPTGRSGFHTSGVAQENFNDVIAGSVDNDSINGLGGNDALDSGSGNDIPDGGGDADSIIGGDNISTAGIDKLDPNRTLINANAISRITGVLDKSDLQEDLNLLQAYPKTKPDGFTKPVRHS